MTDFRKIFLLGLAFILPVVAAAQSGGANDPPAGGAGSGNGGGSGQPLGLQNPLNHDVNTIDKFVVAILKDIILPIGSVVVVIFIIYAGFLFVTARGNEERLKKAKETLLYVIIGAAILLGAVAISAAISGTLCKIAQNLPGCPAGQLLIR